MPSGAGAMRTPSAGWNGSLPWRWMKKWNAGCCAWQGSWMTAEPGNGIPVFTAISVWKWKDILKQRSISAWLKKAQTGRDFMGKPSKYEKETIVNFNEGEKEASIYTFNADLKRRLAEFSKKYPLLCRLEKSTPEGSVTYVLDKSRLSIRLVPPYSEERRAAARAYAKEHGFKSMPGGKDIAWFGGVLRSKQRVRSRYFPRGSR